jgi:hypothetical protein
MGMPGAEGAPAGPPPDPTTMQGALALANQQEAPQAAAETSASPEAAAMPTAPGQMTGYFSGISSKADEEWMEKVTTTCNRWTEILDRSLERVFERQMRVVLEKAAGVKARKQLSIGTLDTESIFTLDTWSKQMDEDIRPVLTSIINDAQSTYAEKSLVRVPMKKEDIMASVDAQMMRIKSINEETAQEISNSIFATLSVLGEEERATTFRSALVTTFTNLLAKKRGQVAEDETRRAWMVGSQI